MGREKRIAESRAKEMTDRKKETEPARPRPANPAASLPAASAPVEPRGETGFGRAVLQIAALYFVPIIIIVLVGKLILGL